MVGAKAKNRKKLSQAFSSYSFSSSILWSIFSRLRMEINYSRKGCNSSKGATIAEMLGRFKEAGPTSRAARQGLIRIGKAPAKMWWGKEASGPLQSKQLPPAN